ncbi:c2 calcium-dependent domain-containing protein 4c-like [Limosa lapponica baueri]|uniref:C2 calcium-dependent domain-containing protein 4c-like n=1 Tax=Limosa lapponica baueri TaxID=1758121 RepID=A0A2I0TQY6_LIMLA|nr:c2 calcium-dependent domain-containing protein 4c-like [Limosa lapponica baueri]
MVPGGTSQLSIKGAIESLLTWTSFKISKPPPEDKVAQKNKDIFNIVMTPDRIPKFFIPSLDIEHISFQPEPEEDTVENSPERRVSDEVVQKRRTTRSKSESYIKKDALCKGEDLDRRGTLCFTDQIIFPGDLERAAHHSDPATRAALSLPHLSKITTPYGFLTLGESPNTRRKESLFFQHDPEELKILLSHRKKTTSLVRNSSSTFRELQQTIECIKPSATPFKTRRAVSWEEVCTSQLSPLHCKSDSETYPVKCEKKRFQMTMKRHLASIKRMRSGSGINWLC